MSDDLFAAFGEAETVPRPPQTKKDDFLTSGHSPGQAEHLHYQQRPNVQSVLEEVDDDDDFGEFEDASDSRNEDQPCHIDPKTTSLSQQSNHQHGSLTLEHVTHTAKPNHLSSRMSQQTEPTEPTSENKQIGRHPFADHMDMLFSGDDDEYNAGQDEWNDLSNDPEAAMAYSKRVIQEQMEQQARNQRGPEPTLTSKASPAQKNVPSHPVGRNEPARHRDPNVLFDADDPSEEDDEDFDDWGDFEGVGQKTAAPARVSAPNTKSAAPNQMPAIDLLGIDDDSPPAISPTTDTKAVRGSKAAGRPTPNPYSPQPGRPAEAAPREDPWDDFDDVPPPTPPKARAPATSNRVTSSVPSSSATLAPTNIPPPSILLSVFPPVLNVPLSPDTLPAHVADCIALAHVIAGRKHRWKRSPSLAASMRIGPTAAGGKGGMKLTGLDRTETAREDREVVDVLTFWRSHVGKLRSSVVTANASAAAERRNMIGKVPEIGQTMPVKALKSVEGGFTAPHECALCGLRREERVVKVDEGVEDNFGEWWVDGTNMHVFCKAWWERNEAALRSR